jgi:hypothetical protein
MCENGRRNESEGVGFFRGRRWRRRGVIPEDDGIERRMDMVV